ncbi:MAG TPA: hypothetical protein VKB58_12765 [Terriglobales bacterium]|jgi:hypothetical protein|nr:hypothetical protein [Terriglobales bacterium]
MKNDFPRHEVRAAVAAIHEKLREGCSEQVAERVCAWMDTLSPSGQAPDYFLQPSMFPMLLVPAWMSESVDVWDGRFQSELVYSSVNAYYSIRLLDNVMDGHETCEKELLPLSAFFHAEFQGVYERYFDASHPFWSSFRSLWLQTADAVVREAQLATMDAQSFREIAANKLSAAKIPLIAVHHHLGGQTDLAQWLLFCDELAAWWQFLDDLMDWYLDDQRGACTYFLSEAERRRGREETRLRWVLREGFEWGVETLEQWREALQRSAHTLHSDDALNFLDERGAMVMQEARRLLPGMQAFEEVALAMDKETLEV